MADYDPDRLLTETPPASATMTVRPRKLDREQVETLVRKYNPDITQAAVKGEADNIWRESSGNAANATGDGGTSGGMYQHHNKRLSELKSYAQKHGKDWTDPEIQVQFSRMEKERDYPALLKLQQTSDDRGRNEDAFKRIFERPASVLWGNDAQGKPVLGNDRYRFSDYAMGEHEGKPNTDMLMMSPREYLDLSPELGGKPFESPSGRSLMRSFNRGEPIESVPTMDVKVDGPTATVTDQDGRHRALLAEQQGIEAIPVAVRQTGEGQPKEIVGADGLPMAHDFPKASEIQNPPAQREARQEQPEQPRETFSLVSPAAAAEPQRNAAGEPVDANPYAQFTAPAGGGGAASADNNPYAQFTGGGAAPAQQEQPGWFDFLTKPHHPAKSLGEAIFSTPGDPVSETIAAGVRGAGKGYGDTVFAGQELLGKGMQAVGIPGGQALTEDARERMATEQARMAPDKAAHPWASGIGEFLGEMAVPGGAAAKLVKPVNALRRAATAGALAGALTPGGGDESFWTNKSIGTGTGAAGGVVGGATGNALSKVVAPTLRATVGKLMAEGVQLTPGQMAGGAAKRSEDVLGSIPLLGAQVRKAQHRSLETFNAAAVNRGLSDIGLKLPPDTYGHNAIAWAQDEFGKAYRAVIPLMRAQVDTNFRTDLNDIVAKAQRENLPQQYLDQLRHVITRDVIEPFRAGGGTLNGTSFQDVGTKLDELIKPLRRSGVYEQQLGGYLREADAALDSMMRRQNPRLQAAKDRIDTGYAKFKTTELASTADGAKDGVFTPSMLSRAVKARDPSKDKRSFAAGDALMQDLSRAGRDVLPQTVPDSGTPERALLMGMIGGAAHIEPHTAAALTGLAVPYTAPASKALNAAVNRLAQPAGTARNALADILRNAGQILAPGAGSAAAGAAPGLVSGFMPGQQ